MTRRRALGAGFFAGFVAGLLMTVTMLLLAWLFGVATPLVIFGDRLSVFIPADTFLSLMGRVGGYNHMKQLGVGSVIAGQLFVGGLGGMIYGLVMRRSEKSRFAFTGFTFVLLPLALAAIFLWPVLGTHYQGLPINAASLVTIGDCSRRFWFLSGRSFSSSDWSPGPGFKSAIRNLARRSGIGHCSRAASRYLRSAEAPS